MLIVYAFFSWAASSSAAAAWPSVAAARSSKIYSQLGHQMALFNAVAKVTHTK
jgi:hypothetical protein